MPEPGINDRDFTDPTANRKKPRRGKPRPRIKLPGEYAEFRLSDGQFLGDVLGDRFFGPETGAQGGRQIGDPPVTVVRTPRIFDYQIPLKKAFEVVEARMVTLVKNGHIDEATKEALLSAMISMREGGKKTITLADYADLYTKFVPAAVAKGTGVVRYGAGGEQD